MVTSVMILGFVVSKEGKFADPKKIQALLDMPAPNDVCGIQVFFGLAQFKTYPEIGTVFMDSQLY